MITNALCYFTHAAKSLLTLEGKKSDIVARKTVLKIPASLITNFSSTTFY